MNRTEESEWMEEPTLSNELLDGALKSIDGIHRLFFTLRTLISTIGDLLSTNDPELPLSILDVGAGTGYLGTRLKEQFGDQIYYIPLDYSHRILNQFNNQSEHKTVGSAEELPLTENSVDVVVSSLTLHHLPAEELVPFLQSSRQCARHLACHMDLVRSELAYITLKTLTRVISRNPVFHADAPRSVRRSLNHNEWKSLMRYPDLERYRMVPQPPFLVNLVGR